MPERYDTHNLSLTDLPHVIRLSGEGVVLDSCLASTTAGGGGNWLASLMPHTSRHTLVARYEGQRVVGQFYITPDGDGAQIIYLAPHLPTSGEDSAWLLILDAMVREAGRRGAHALTAELDETSPLFETMRSSGFAVYARQNLWMAPPEPREDDDSPTPDLRPTDDRDAAHVQIIFQRTVPSLLQHVIPNPPPQGFLYYEEGVLLGFVAVADGRDGVYIMPYLDHRMSGDPGVLVREVGKRVRGSERRTATVRVRRYQGWMNAPLENMGYSLVAKQAVMVRHIGAGVHSPGFAPLSKKLAAGATPRRTDKVTEVCFDAGKNNQREETMKQENWTYIGSRERCDGMTRTAPQRHPVCPNGGVPG